MNVVLRNWMLYTVVLSQHPRNRHSRRPAQPVRAVNVASSKHYDDQAAEYVFSTLKVALSQPHHPSHSNNIAFKPLRYDFFKNGVARTERSNDVPTDTAAPMSDEGSFEPEDKDTLENYRKWDHELYSQIRLDRASIRLVEILPGQPGDDVSVSMTMHLLDEVAMRYEALSYV
jgi:hypothetical protein